MIMKQIDYLRRLAFTLLTILFFHAEASASDLTASFSPGELRLSLSSEELLVIRTLSAVKELRAEEGVGDEILFYNATTNKLLFTIGAYVTVNDEVMAEDNITHELTDADWALFDSTPIFADIATELLSRSVDKVVLLFSASTGSEEVSVEISNGLSFATALSGQQGNCIQALIALGVLTQEPYGSTMAFVHNGKPLFYIDGDSPATAVIKICDGVTEADNFTYVFTSADLEMLAGIEIPGSGGMSLGQMIADVSKVTFTFVGVPADTSFDPYTTPLTIEAMEGATTVTITNPLGLTIGYSMDGGSTWTTASSSTITIIGIAAGSKVCLRGDNDAYGKLSGESTTITFDKDCYVYGNVMSLVSSTGFATLTTLSAPATFQQLFWKNTHFVSHPTKELVLPATTLTRRCYNGMFGSSTISKSPVLPATVLAEDCYFAMFSFCTQLTEPPVLPATQLATSCYHGMFEGCIGLTVAPALPATTLDWNCYENMFRETALTTAPDLPATQLAPYCYEGMFWKCTSLETPPALPATELEKGCYEYMFYYCTALTEAPELPAMTLADYCYSEMFYYCTKLEKAPVLAAPVLVTGCYADMFAKCENLNYVECLATDLSANDNPDEWQRATNNWLYGVAASGTFVKADGVTAWTTGESGIPTGWTVEDVSTDIRSLTATPSQGEGAWYSIDGRQLQGEPIAAGIYVKNGRKVLIK